MTDPVINPLSLKGKTILVTGASSGIGRATAILCSHLGAAIVATGRNIGRLEACMQELNGEGHTCICADLTDSESVTALIESLPKLDGVVLCAGINNTLPLAFFTEKKVSDIFAVNYFSQTELFRIILKKKRLNSGASVVAISSIGGTLTYSPGASAYGASKAALLSWTKSAAKELAPKVRINSICPGQINTPMNDNTSVSEEQYETYRKSIPMQCFGEPEDVAHGVAYLLSDAARWITGSTLVIDGGSSL